jgi:hypothetical protein
MPMQDGLIRDLEAFLQQQDFGKNWDGAYQDVIPTIRTYFRTHGFELRDVSEWESPSREPELIASRTDIIIRIPWAEDRNGRSVVHLDRIQVQLSHSA